MNDNYINDYPVCDNCKYSKTLYCTYFNSECISINIKNHRHEIPCEQCLKEKRYTPISQNDNLDNDNSYIKKAYFHIPEISILSNIKILLTEKDKYPNCFYPNRIISEIYDAFPGTIWNGRTPMFGKPFLSIQEINDIKNEIESLNLSLNLTWNNHLINKQQLYDTYCNLITELFNDGGHSITISSDILYTYIKEKYPNFIFYHSIIAGEKQKKIDKQDNYDMILAPVIYNNNDNLLFNLPLNLKNKIVLLCNDNCFPMCNKFEHYSIANYCLNSCCYESIAFPHECNIDNDFRFYNTQRWPTTILPEQIDNYVAQGFSHFKLCSRGDDKDILIYKLCQYFIKPQFFSDFYFKILRG